MIRSQDDISALQLDLIWLQKRLTKSRRFCLFVCVFVDDLANRSLRQSWDEQVRCWSNVASILPACVERKDVAAPNWHPNMISYVQRKAKHSNIQKTFFRLTRQMNTIPLKLKAGLKVNTFSITAHISYGNEHLESNFIIPHLLPLSNSEVESHTRGPVKL